MATIRGNRRRCFARNQIDVIELRKSVLILCALAGLAWLLPSSATAQSWWTRKPVDFEECADMAEKASSKEARSDSLAECNAKFAGRRKPGGGYTFYDFMQDRTFDIAGPNPTPEEQKFIDEQYTVYLEKQRRNSIAAAFAAQQPQPSQQQALPQQSTIRSAEVPKSGEVERERIPLPQQRPTKAQMAAAQAALAAEARRKCAKENSFSCEWPKLSETLSDLKKKLFGNQAPPQQPGPSQQQQKTTKRI